MRNSLQLRSMFAFAAVAIVLVACLGPVPTPTAFPTPIPVFVATPETPTAQPTSNEKSAGTTQVNLDALAPPGTARDSLIMYCGNCHSFVCAMLGQRTREHWEQVKLLHKNEHMVDMPSQDYDFLFLYLELNFNDQKPVPDLPPALQNQGCTTAQR